MTSNLIDRKFIGLVSGRLKNITYKGSSSVLASFTHSCERANKRRGHFLSYKGTTFFRCFNCGSSLSLSQFLKDTDQTLYREYCLENFREGVWESREPEHSILDDSTEPEKIAPERSDYFDTLIPYSSLRDNHPALSYVTSRGIPRERYLEFFLAPNFFKWASNFDPVFSRFEKSVPRLVIPYYGSLNSNLLGFSCRAFGKELPKYIHLRVDKTNEFIYGLSRLDMSKPILVTEGPLDSTFLSNCIAMGGASFKSEFISSHKENVIIIPDNDFRRNLHVFNQLRAAVDAGNKICLLPSHWPKDINDCIKKGISSDSIHNYISENTKFGLAAKLELALEKKC
jgi:hypothetical protein